MDYTKNFGGNDFSDGANSAAAIVGSVLAIAAVVGIGIYAAKKMKGKLIGKVAEVMFESNADESDDGMEDEINEESDDSLIDDVDKVIDIDEIDGVDLMPRE